MGLETKFHPVGYCSLIDYVLAESDHPDADRNAVANKYCESASNRKRCLVAIAGECPFYNQYGQGRAS